MNQDSCFHGTTFPALAQSMASVPLLSGIPAANDNFFENEPGLVASFDFDYDEVVSFYQKLRWAQFIFVPASWISSLCCTPCFINQNVEWNRRNMHVALTVDGIKFVHDRRKDVCGLSCTDRGKESKTVPYDKITDCDVTEPAGTAFCCCIQNTLHTVTVDTASSGIKDGTPSHELRLEGLVHPHDFKQAVWAMKRQNQGSQVPRQAEMMSMTSLVEDVNTPLLKDIREELRTLNSLMAAKYGSA